MKVTRDFLTDLEYKLDDLIRDWEGLEIEKKKFGLGIFKKDQAESLRRYLAKNLRTFINEYEEEL